MITTDKDKCAPHTDSLDPQWMEPHQSLLIHCVHQVQRAVASLSSIAYHTPGDSGLLNNVEVTSSDRHKRSRSTVEVAQSGPLGQMNTERDNKKHQNKISGPF